MLEPSRISYVTPRNNYKYLPFEVEELEGTRGAGDPDRGDSRPRANTAADDGETAGHPLVTVAVGVELGVLEVGTAVQPDGRVILGRDLDGIRDGWLESLAL